MNIYPYWDRRSHIMKTQPYDVVVVGSGSAGATAALRACELGLSVLIIEKAHKYGGTSATSGGVLWIPNHGPSKGGDSREQALEYLNHLVSATSSAIAWKRSLIRGPRWCASCSP